jgi:hypothetical protein
VEATTRQFIVYLKENEVKRMDIKGLHGKREMSFEEYVKLIAQEASSDYKQTWAKRYQPRQ